MLICCKNSVEIERVSIIFAIANFSWYVFYIEKIFTRGKDNGRIS